jgi:hypothetical protein
MTDETWDADETKKTVEQVRFSLREREEIYYLYIATGSINTTTFGSWTWKATT